MNRRLMILGAIFGLTAVILGAFGAHGLKEMVGAEAIASFETGVRYQMYHAFLALFIGGVFKLSPKLNLTLFWLLLVGVLFFSGSIYLLSTQEFTGLNFSRIALITPLGGLFLIISWTILAVKFVIR